MHLTNLNYILFSAEIDIKIEGLNGQLPNLDLLNLASKMCSKEGVFQTFKNRGPTYSKYPIMDWWNDFKNLLAMMATQATGVIKNTSMWLFCSSKYF